MSELVRMNRNVELWVMDIAVQGHPKYGTDTNDHIMVLVENDGDRALVVASANRALIEGDDKLLDQPINVEFNRDRSMVEYKGEKYFSTFEGSDGVVILEKDGAIRVGMYRETAVALNEMYGPQVNSMIQTIDWAEYVDLEDKDMPIGEILDRLVAITNIVNLDMEMDQLLDELMESIKQEPRMLARGKVDKETGEIIWRVNTGRGEEQTITSTQLKILAKGLK